MKIVRQLAVVALVIVCGAAFLAEFVAPADYATQFRESPNAAPSYRHWLGTDELGRDRLSRLLYGTRISLLLAPSAALLSIVMAAAIGATAGYMGGMAEKAALAASDLLLSVPWLFLLLIVRASMPLNVSPALSAVITFGMLGLLGWAASARVLCARARSLRDSEMILQARAVGCSSFQLVFRHLLPNLKPLMFAQFWISVPVFILSEANLGMLGLGVAEPLPSWGGLLRDLETSFGLFHQPWRLVPLCVLVLVVVSMQLVMTREEVVA